MVVGPKRGAGKAEVAPGRGTGTLNGGPQAVVEGRERPRARSVCYRERLERRKEPAAEEWQTAGLSRDRQSTEARKTNKHQRIRDTTVTATEKGTTSKLLVAAASTANTRQYSDK